MVRAGIILAAVALALPVQAAELPEVRPVEIQDVDVFAVLQTLTRAEAAFAARDYASALRGYHLVHAHDPRQVDARRGLRRSYLARGDWKTAKTYAETDIADNALIAALRDGDTEPLELALVTEKSDPRLWTALGQLQDHVGDHMQARESYRKAADVGARAGLASNNIGQSFLLEGQPEIALRAFNAAVLQDPTDLRFDNNRRRTLLRLDRLEDAVADLSGERAATFLGEAGRQALSDGEPKLARHLLAAARRLSPRHDPALAALAERAARQ